MQILHQHFPEFPIQAAPSPIFQLTNLNSYLSITSIPPVTEVPYSFLRAVFTVGFILHYLLLMLILLFHLIVTPPH